MLPVLFVLDAGAGGATPTAGFARGTALGAVAGAVQPALAGNPGEGEGEGVGDTPELPWFRPAGFVLIGGGAARYAVACCCWRTEERAARSAGESCSWPRTSWGRTGTYFDLGPVDLEYWSEAELDAALC